MKKNVDVVPLEIFPPAICLFIRDKYFRGLNMG